jgi:branched-chain amino acid aminotransferase
LSSINRESNAIAGTSHNEILRNSDNSSGNYPRSSRPAMWMAAMVAIVKPVSFSQNWTFFEGAWHGGNVPIMGARTHAAWLGSTVFDGARVFEGVAPDLDRHCARVNQSAINFGLKPVVDAETWLGLAREGIARFGANAELYVRPMYWAQNGSGGGVLFDPETTNWCLCIYVAPMPQPTGTAITLSPFRRPTAESAPVHAKAACLYPNNSRALIEAQARGFGNCLLLDALGNVAEFGNSNVFMAKDGVVYTPAPNGTFLDGITRQRVIGLLRGDGVTVVEATLKYEDFLGADEIFSSGNFAKVAPVIRIDDRSLQPGPFYSRARKLYWDFAHG